ncbi:MAG: D-glycero-beta-D-manno-heptose 1-phosphate adenylyltransferase [Vicinamibacteria bacterium]|nr:D-glycero-beta-D-manno-heptose 1-phosphate adenylyltransferase [Vicinamibacteria bacterium]
MSAPSTPGGAGVAITARDLTKVYRKYLHKNQFTTLKSAIVSGSLIRDLSPSELFTALDHVSFDIPRGCTYGILGENGSGKSTTLKLLSGITKPSSGSLDVSGRVSALIELGAGFHPEISGRENVAINGVMLGVSRAEVMRRFDEIVEFAEMKDFIDAPVKTYSSGMYARLGFAVAIHVDPDILLIDEVLSVGDEAFTRKCLEKIGEFRRRGKTIVIVTHSLGLVEKMCDEALWLRKGKTMDSGDPKRVVDAYLSFVAAQENELLGKKTQIEVAQSEARGTSDAPEEKRRWGSGEMLLTDVRLKDEGGRTAHVFVPGDTLRIEITGEAKTPVLDFVFGLGIFTAGGTAVYGTNTHIEEYKSKRAEGVFSVMIEIQDLRLVEGSYLLDVAVHRKDGTPYDYHRGLYALRVRSRVKDVGVYRPHHKWTFSEALQIDEPPERHELELRPTDRVDRREGADSMETLHNDRASFRALGKSVVFTNGCFDILHAGHVSLLERASAEGDVLVVAINSDASVKRLKGESRPVISEAERAEALLALECVDRVLIYDEDTPLECIRALRPDVLVKGADWALDNIVGRDDVEKLGGRVVRVDLWPDRSTTGLIKKAESRAHAVPK